MITILQMKKHYREIVGPALTIWLIANLGLNPASLMLKLRFCLLSHNDTIEKGGDEYGRIPRRGPQ